MSLPKLAVTKHKLKLPSTGEEILYRPFLVKEEKILMMALQGQDAVDVVQALRDVIESCVESKIDIKKFTMFDIEYVFLQLRARSVGDTIQLKYSSPENLCKDNKTQCSFAIEIKIDEIKIDKQKDHKDLIDLTESIKVKLKYPEIEMANSLTGKSQSELVDATFQMIGQSIEYIMDGVEMHNPADYTEKELDDFLNSLSTEQFQKIQKFFDTMPRLRHEVTGKCSICEKENKRVLEGLGDFFA